MSEFLEDPSVLTKDKLKSVLLANNVSLPNSEQRKDVYVQLYLKNLTAQNKKKSAPPPEPFSSDDELPAPVVSNRSSRSGRKATKKTDKPRPEEVDVLELSDEDLREELRKYGLSVGPIVASTRKLYERKLQKLIDEGPPEATPPPEVVTETDGNQNGGAESDHYSDKEEEVAPEPEPEPEPAPVVERPLRSRGKTPVTSRAGSRSSQHNRVEKVSATLDQTPKSDAKDVLKDMFPNDVDTPTGISATCRRPIRGAASRAGLSSDSWLDDATRQRLNHLSETSTSYYSSSYLESRTPSSRLLNSPAPPAYTSSSSTLYSTSISTPLRAVSVPSVRAPIGGVGSVAGGGGGRKRWMPVWVQVLVFGVLAGFLFLVYQAMETNESNPFGFLSQSQPQLGEEGTPTGQTSK
ncbi:thymopoietin a isoform X2 [Engraulis encrasicolus]|uniref:thymopoietin a isoform X2 n=1 Tax=Engraulis encrasicolus TaxID=184585 RepID=UPI002FD3BE57